MSKQNPLYELIQNLTTTEKRYFKLFAKLHGKKSDLDYLKLFDYIEKNKKLSESAITRHLAKHTSIKNLPAAKNYLYQIILKSLRIYHFESKSRFIVNGLIQDIHILLEKNLIQQANKRLIKAKKIVKQYQFNQLYLEILLIERSIIRSFEIRHSEELLAANQEETKTCMEQVNAHFEILDLYDKVFLMIRNKMILSESSEAILAQINSITELADNTDLSFDTQMTFHLIWANYYRFLEEKESSKMQDHLKIILDLFNDNQHFIKEYEIRYINVISLYLYSYSRLGDFNLFPEMISKLEALKPRSEYIKVKLFQAIYGLKLLEYLGKHQYQTALDLLPPLTKGLEQYQNKLHKTFLLEISQNIAVIYFFNGQFNEALEWLHRVINDKRHEVRQDIQLFCKSLLLIIHFELDHTELVSSLGTSAIRSSRKTDQEHYIYSLAKAILKAIDKDTSDKNKILQNLFVRLERKKSDASGMREVLYWLEHRIQ